MEHYCKWSQDEEIAEIEKSLVYGELGEGLSGRLHVSGEKEPTQVRVQGDLHMEQIRVGVAYLSRWSLLEFVSNICT